MMSMMTSKFSPIPFSFFFLLSLCLVFAADDPEGSAKAKVLMQKDLTTAGAVAWNEPERFTPPRLSIELKESQALEEEEEDFKHFKHKDFQEKSTKSTSNGPNVAGPLLRSALVVTLLHLAWLFCRKSEVKAELKEKDEATENDLGSEFLKPLNLATAPFEVDRFGCTALHVAADKADESEVRKLLDTMKTQDQTWNSQLTSNDANSSQSPCFNAEVSHASLVLDFVNARDAWDETALHMAARRGSLPCCHLLLEARADVNAPNASAQTPLQICGEAAEDFFKNEEQFESESQRFGPHFEDFEELCHHFLDLGATLGPLGEDQATQPRLPRLCAMALAVRCTLGERQER